MKAHNAVFTLSDGPDRWRVEFDLMPIKTKRWVVYVSVNGSDVRKTWSTNLHPSASNALVFTRKY